MPRSLVVPLVLLALLASCTRPQNEATTGTSLAAPTGATTTTPDAPTTVPETSAPATTTPSSTAQTTAPSTDPVSTAPGTTPATTPATAPGTSPPTTVPTIESAGDLTLAFDGIEPLGFGQRDVDVVPVLSSIFGDPISDEVAEYPTADGGEFLDEIGETAYVAPFGRTVCWGNGLCAEFGAGAIETLIFTGWRVDPTSPGDLATVDGIAVGSSLVDHVDDIDYDPLNSCFSVAFATADGIDVLLQSDGDPFATVNDDGEFVSFDPPPEVIRVLSLEAGELPIFVFEDC